MMYFTLGFAILAFFGAVGLIGGMLYDQTHNV